jgi:hypothetical protein
MQHLEAFSESESEVREPHLLLRLERDDILALHEGLTHLNEAGLLPSRLLSLQTQLASKVLQESERNRYDHLLCIK